MKKPFNGEKLFTRVAYCVLMILGAMTLAPVLLLLISSVTDEMTLVQNGYAFVPAKLSLEAYQALLGQQSALADAYGNTVAVTLIGTGANVLITLLYAYPLSRRDFKYRRFFTFLAFFTMLFNGGVVPSYILWTRYLQIKNTLWALVLPNYLFSAFNVLLIKNYITHTIPGALTESAEIDGAGETRIFWQIVIPLSTPVIATVALFSGIVYWNDWINGLYFISNKRLYTIQLLLNEIMSNIQFLSSGLAAMMGANAKVPSVSYRMAIAALGILPVVIILPFIQKYLVRGTVIGALKE